MRRFLSLVLLCAWLLPLSAVGGGGLKQAINTLVDQVDARYNTIHDLQADFTQETKVEGFETPLTSSGKVFLKKPGLLRWEYVDPSVEQIFVHGDNVQIFVPEHNQVIQGNLTQMMATKAPLQLLQGAGKLAEEFIVTPTEKGEQGEGGLPLLMLVPRQKGQGESSSITHIVSEIEPKTHLIKSISLHEVSGNISTFHFANMRTNKNLSNSVFELDLPEGVVIVEDIFPQ